MSLLRPKKNQTELPPRRRKGAAGPDQKPTSSQLFRRNRTLTGSRSGLFGSANENQADLKSPRAATHELAKRRQKLLRLLAGSVAGALLLVVLLWQMIVGVSVYGSDVALEDSTSYQTTIEEYLLRHPLQRFRFSVDESGLFGHVASTHPEVKSVQLSQPLGPASSRFEFQFRQPIAEWSVGGEIQYVDQGGVAFERNYYNKPAIQIVDNSGIDPSSGVALASGRFLGFVGHTVRLSESIGYNPTDIEIPASTTRQVEVSYKSLSYPVKFNIDRSAGEQVEDMDRAIKHLRQVGEKPAYLDVRVSGRAFYR